MSTKLWTITLEDSTDWRSYFGKRYLDVSSFVKLCEAAGLADCSERELEEYERERLMFPVARIVMPERYARPYYEAFFAHAEKYEIDDDLLSLDDLRLALSFQIPLPNEPPHFDLRHPIDQKLGLVPSLVQPNREQYQPWENFSITIQVQGHSIRHSTATHYYHHWQMFELYEVRRYYKGMYKDRASDIPPRRWTNS